MKTAMQELIEWIESNEIIYNKELILKLKELLEKEKEQIINDFDNGIYVGTYAVDKDGEQYYNETYNQKSIDAAELLYNIVKKEVDELNKNLG